MKYIFSLLLVCSTFTTFSQQIDLDLKPKQAAQELFQLAAEMDVIISKWQFYFAYPDSNKLASLIPFIAKNLKLEIEGIEYEEDFSKKYPKAYVFKTSDNAVYDKKTLEERIKQIEKMLKRSKIVLGSIGFDYYKLDNKNNRPLKEYTKSSYQIAGKVISETEPIPYATIGIIDKNIGCVSELDGSFVLEIPRERIFDTLQISHVGYIGKKIRIDELIEKEQISIRLSKKNVKISQIDVKAKSSVKKLILGQKKAGNKFGFVYGKGSGAEAAKLMKLGNRKILLTRVGLFINNKSATPFKLQLKIYEQEPNNGLPGEQILNDVILVESQLSSGWLEVNLNKYNIILDKNFYVAFQWTNDDSRSPEIAIKGSAGYVRSIAQGKWIETKDFSWVIKAEGVLLN